MPLPLTKSFRAKSSLLRPAAPVSLLVALTLSLGGATGAAHADSINVDFNLDNSPTYNGVGAAPDTGTFWNGFGATGSQQTLSNLKNSMGAATGVSVTTGVNFVADSPTRQQASGNSASALLRDYLFTDVPQNVTLNGLTAGTSYDLYLYGVGPSAAGSGDVSRTAFTVGGVTQNTIGPNGATTNLTLGEDYVMFRGLMATNNAITICYAAPNGESFSVFNGLQVQTSAVAPVPEPSTWATMFLGVGAIGLVMCRKRRESPEAEFAAAAI